MPLDATARRLFSFPVLLAAGLTAVAFLTVSNRFNDPDLWWHLRVGQSIWTAHAVPSRETFSFTAFGHPWIAHEWLGQLAIYAAYALAGYRGLMLWLSATASLVFVLVYWRCWIESRNALAAFLAGLTAWFFGTVSLAIRPLLAGHAMLAAELLILELARTRSRRWLWALPPLFAAWSNLHGSYAFGIGVLLVYWICSCLNGKWGLIASEPWDSAGWRQLGGTLGLCVAALCLNPSGPRILLYPFNMMLQQSTTTAVVQEWLPPDLSGPRALAMLAGAGAMLLVPLLRRSRIELRDLLLVLAALGLALRHDRMIFLFGIVAAPVFCRILAAEIRQGTGPEHPVANAVFILACLAAMWAGFPGDSAIRRQIADTSPVAAVDYIRRAGLSGPMLNDYQFGGYVMWALPEEKDFIDGRADVFDWTGVMKEYGRWATLAEDPAILLKKYRIRFCLLSKDAAMANVLPYLPGWRKVYGDNVAVVFVSL